MIKGHIISSQKDRYLVSIDGAEKKEDSLLLCQGRGVFREKSIIPIVGDFVEVEVNGQEGTIVTVLPRKNLLFRPPVANIDQVLIVQTIAFPDMISLSFDKLLAVMEKRELSILICFNKTDRVSSSKLQEWIFCYEAIGYPVFAVNSLTGEGFFSLEQSLLHKTTAVAGPSGAGKSTMIQRLTGDCRVQAGDLSVKTNRGKQTTRHTMLYEIAQGSYIFDTPGFSTLDLRDFAFPKELEVCFPEIRREADKCRFRNCTHRREPDCEIRSLVQEGKIALSRYENYLTMYAEVERNQSYGRKRGY